MVLQLLRILGPSCSSDNQNPACCNGSLVVFKPTCFVAAPYSSHFCCARFALCFVSGAMVVEGRAVHGCSWGNFGPKLSPKAQKPTPDRSPKP